jgi:hypothetical protein
MEEQTIFSPDWVVDQSDNGYVFPLDRINLAGTPPTME